MMIFEFIYNVRHIFTSILAEIPNKLEKNLFKKLNSRISKSEN